MPRKVPNPDICLRCTKPRHVYKTKKGLEKKSPFCLEHMEKEREYKRRQRMSVGRYNSSPSYKTATTKKG